MARYRTVLLGLVAVGMFIGQLLVPVGGYTFVVGDSMAPTIPAGCSIVGAQAWDGESSLEGEIVAYRTAHHTPDSIDASWLPTDPWVAHRVVAEYEAYNAATATHAISKQGFLTVETEVGTKLLVTSQDHATLTALEGERVLVLKGDNNERIDPVLVADDDVLGVITADTHVHLQDLESWPCSWLHPGSP